MLKKISVLLLAASLLWSMTACSMPDSIFPDDAFASDETETMSNSVNLYAFQFTLDAQTYALPDSCKVFSVRGWTLSDATSAEDGEEGEAQKTYSADTMMEAGEYSDYVKATNGSTEVEFKVYNDGKKSAPLNECKVVGIRVNSDTTHVPAFTLADDVKLGSTYEYVVDTFGKPSYEKSFVKTSGELAAINDVEFIEDAENVQKVLYYALDEHAFVSFTLGSYQGNDNTAVVITMENDTEAEAVYDYEKDAGSKKIPEEVGLYKAPSMLGKRFSDMAFKYEGNLYTLPIPVRELIEDGWTFVRGAELSVPRNTTMGGVMLLKDNLAVEVLVHNYDLTANQRPVNCYAVSLSANVVGPNVNIMLPKGVTLGSDESELIAAYGDEYQTEDEESEQEVEEETEIPQTAETTQEEPAAVIEKQETDEYIVYSYIMPDDVPTVPLPVSITDMKDPGVELLGDHRKHIDVYVSQDNHKVVSIYMQNCPEYVVDETKIWEEYLEKATKEQEAANNNP